jgi:hypothetical protein
VYGIFGLTRRGCGKRYRMSTAHRLKDITGQRFGRLVALEMVGFDKGRSSVWRLVCDCGKEKITSRKTLVHKNVRSCGCLADESRRSEKKPKGERHSLKPEYRLYWSAKERSNRRGLECTISPADIHIPRFCPLLGLELKSGTKENKGTSPSLDRLDCKKGYVRGNVWVISHRANSIKRDATLEELEQICIGLRMKLEQAA